MASISSHEGENTQSQTESHWSLLPTDLLDVISRKIADIADFARFRSVCRSWRSAAKPCNLSPRLLLPYDPRSSSRSFYSISTESTITIDLPELHSRIICGSSNGWLVTLDQTLNFSLFNPLTRSLTNLPPISTLPEPFARVVDEYDRAHICHGNGTVITLERLDNFFDCYASISPNPHSSAIDGGVVVFMVAGYQVAQYWRLGDVAWNPVVLGSGVSLITFHKGKLYVVYIDGTTATCDLGKQENATVVPSLKLGKLSPYCYLVTSPREELFLITWCKGDWYEDVFVYGDLYFKYHKLEEREGRMIWSRVGEIGDCAAFLSHGMSAVMGRQMPVACSAPVYKRNCVYYVYPVKSFWREVRQLSHVKLTVIEEGVLRDIRHGPWETPHPDSLSSWWIIPSFN